MKIDKKLNLVIPIQTEVGELWLHSTPITLETFKLYYKTISKAYAEIFSEGVKYAATSGPRVAAMEIEAVARKEGTWEGPAGVENGLINEIIRLTNVFMPTDKGWTMIPLDDAIRGGTLSVNDKEEVVNAIAFFTLFSSMENKASVETFMGWISQRWGGRLDAWSCMECQSSLPTSSGAANTGATV